MSRRFLTLFILLLCGLSSALPGGRSAASAASGETEHPGDISLDVRFSKTEFTVGESVTVEVVARFGRDVADVRMDLPMPDNDVFILRDTALKKEPDGNLYRIPLGQGAIWAERGREVLGGKTFATLSFRKALFARSQGGFDFPGWTLTCLAAGENAGNTRSSSPFDRFFGGDLYNRGNGPTGTLTLRSPPVSITVLPLPEKGKPLSFQGWVGRVRIEVSAEPVDVEVGEPITLTVAVRGQGIRGADEVPPEFVLDASSNPAMARDFRIPERGSPGTMRDDGIVYSRTIRPKSEAVTFIPPVELSYFDPETRSYGVARSEAIVVRVRPAAGEKQAGGVESAEHRRERRLLESWSRGLAGNFEGPDLLVNRSIGPLFPLDSLLFLAGLMIPPIVFLSLFFLRERGRTRTVREEASRTKNAFSAFERRVHLIRSAGASDSRSLSLLLEALRGYFRDRLRLESAALSFPDFEMQFMRQGCDSEVLARAHTVFSDCEKARFGGGRCSKESVDELTREVCVLVRELDAKISRTTSRGRGGSTTVLFIVLSILFAIHLPQILRALGPDDLLNFRGRGEQSFREAQSLAASHPRRAVELFLRAAGCFESIVREGIENGPLYYNIGNCHHHAGDLGRAILNYRRAERFMPGDEDLKSNIALARGRIEDKMEPRARDRFFRSLFSPHYTLSPAAKADHFILFSCLLWGFSTVALFRGGAGIRLCIVLCCCAVLLLGGSLGVDAFDRRFASSGVIVFGEVVARQGDSLVFEPALAGSLHAGTEFRVVEERAGWYRIELVDGRRAWIPVESTELVWGGSLPGAGEPSDAGRK